MDHMTVNLTEQPPEGILYISQLLLYSAGSIQSGESEAFGRLEVTGKLVRQGSVVKWG